MVVIFSNENVAQSTENSILKFQETYGDRHMLSIEPDPDLRPTVNDDTEGDQEFLVEITGDSDDTPAVEVNAALTPAVDGPHPSSRC